MTDKTQWLPTLWFYIFRKTYKLTNPRQKNVLNDDIMPNIICRNQLMPN